jgi:type II secretory pathway pseudopilin PulG
MAARVRLSARDLSVEPGAQVALDCTITNVGAVVDAFHIRILGDAARWADPGPPLNLMPGQEGVARIIFSPPRAAATTAEAVVFGVQVVSTQDPDGGTVEEALLNVQPFSDTNAELLPATSHGSRRGRHDVAIDNRGNQRVAVQFSAADQANALRFRFNPPQAVIQPGNAAFSRLTATARKRFWRGPARTHPFELLVRAQNGQRSTVLQGAMVQQATLPRWLPAAAVAAVAILGVLAAAWLGLLRPAIQSAAQQAVQQPLQQQATAARNAQQAADAANQRAQQAAAQVAVLTGGPPTSPTPSGNPLGNPSDGRLAGNAAFKVPDKNTLSITDLVIENPNDESGTLHLQRDGKDLLVLKLDNFRDLDYHFVTPITVASGQQLQTVCQPASGSTPCGAGVYYDGFMKAPPPAT